jgi:hypothetical protein
MKTHERHPFAPQFAVDRPMAAAYVFAVMDLPGAVQE